VLKVSGERVEALTLYTLPFFAVCKESLKMCMCFKAFLLCVLFLRTGMVVLLILCTLTRRMSEVNQNIFIEKGKEKD